MIASTSARLRERAVDGGVDTDELTLTHEDDGFRLVVADETHEGLSPDALREVLLDEYPAALHEWHFWHETAPEAPARWAFLRWLEDADAAAPPERRAALADGVTAPWGQLHLTVHLGDADRRVYAVRHVDDADRPADALDRHDDPLDARRLAKFDDDGRYRPLSTAPTLQTGWRFDGLDAAALVRTVDFFYPATIANWHRERTGTLDVTHWAEATDRQTGIYAVTAELEGDAVDWVAEACCADSQCLKRRQWDEHPDRALDVPRGEGAFPCREPCSLVIAAARTWAKLEREEEQTYTLRLTPSEKEQLDALLKAVAEGTVDDIREADVRNGANRYRARYLRAKRGDDAGRLGGEATDE
jgi:hypothetical protein